MGFDDILTAIALGTRLTKAVVSLKKHIDDLRSGATSESLQPSPIEALDKRTSDLESLARKQAARIGDLEIGLEDAAVVTSALAERVTTIFWITVLGGTVGLIALILSILAIGHSLSFRPSPEQALDDGFAFITTVVRDCRFVWPSVL